MSSRCVRPDAPHRLTFRQAVIVNLAFALVLALALLLAGCAPAVPAACPRIDMPAPIPQTVTVRIDPGHVEADAGGEQLLREYAAVRAAIRALWGE